MIQIDDAILNAWAADDAADPVALHLRQQLIPVEGEDGVFFPPTYARESGDVPPYAIDTLSDGTKVAQVDSVGSQANRMEPLFKRSPAGKRPNELSSLVPQIEIDIGNDRTINLLEAGHRLGDAIVRCSDLHEEAQDAFRHWLDNGDASKIGKLAPTTLVFGAWDSRDTQAKLPRVVQAVIRAWDVEVLRRSAQYQPAANYSELGVFTPEEGEKATASSKLAERGFVHVPSVDAPGGITARGGIWRDVTVNLIALRQIGGEYGEQLRRYILGLALVAACTPQDGFLRQGCLLTLDSGAQAEWHVIERRGKRQAISMGEEIVRSYAFAAAKSFGVGPDKRKPFLKERARKDVGKSDDGDSKKKGRVQA